jgi:hypothetical protein
LDEIKAAVGNYQNKLKAAVAEIQKETVPMTQQVKSTMVSIE